MIAYVNNQISCKSKGDTFEKKNNQILLQIEKKKNYQINWSMARKCKKKCKCIP